jgi:hypothetical protein
VLLILILALLTAGTGNVVTYCHTDAECSAIQVSFNEEERLSND